MSHRSTFGRNLVIVKRHFFHPPIIVPKVWRYAALANSCSIHCRKSRSAVPYVASWRPAKTKRSNNFCMVRDDENHQRPTDTKRGLGSNGDVISGPEFRIAQFLTIQKALITSKRVEDKREVFVEHE